MQVTFVQFRKKKKNACGPTNKLETDSVHGSNVPSLLFCFSFLRIVRARSSHSVLVPPPVNNALIKWSQNNTTATLCARFLGPDVLSVFGSPQCRETICSSSFSSTLSELMHLGSAAHAAACAAVGVVNITHVGIAAFQLPYIPHVNVLSDVWNCWLKAHRNMTEHKTQNFSHESESNVAPRTTVTSKKTRTGSANGCARDQATTNATTRASATADTDTGTEKENGMQKESQVQVIPQGALTFL